MSLILQAFTTPFVSRIDPGDDDTDLPDDDGSSYPDPS